MPPAAALASCGSGCTVLSIRFRLLLKHRGALATSPALLSNLLMTIRFRGNGTPLRSATCGLLAVWGLCLTVGFGVAASLEPDPRGFGTHQRLGLPPCTIRTLFGIPCPGCGMTTCFANFVRGRFLQAAQANTAGVLLAAVCAVGVPWSLASAVAGRALFLRQPERVAAALVISIASIALIEWVIRLTVPVAS